MAPQLFENHQLFRVGNSNTILVSAPIPTLFPIRIFGRQAGRKKIKQSSLFINLLAGAIVHGP